VYELYAFTFRTASNKSFDWQLSTEEQKMSNETFVRNYFYSIELHLRMVFLYQNSCIILSMH